VKEKGEVWHPRNKKQGKEQTRQTGTELKGAREEEQGEEGQGHDCQCHDGGTDS
jgi:hypothetical protein